MIQKCPFAVVQVKIGSKAHGAQQLDFELRCSDILGTSYVGQYIEVGRERRAGAPGILPGLVHQTPAVRLDVDCQVDQQ